jgi:hypothetical protein
MDEFSPADCRNCLARLPYPACTRVYIFESQSISWPVGILSRGKDTGPPAANRNSKGSTIDEDSDLERQFRAAAARPSADLVERMFSGYRVPSGDQVCR